MCMYFPWMQISLDLVLYECLSKGFGVTLFQDSTFLLLPVALHFIACQEGAAMISHPIELRGT